ncbi:uncharacterized protein EMH_0022290 [Eimeria mitis]|uniref:Uncharacterized protein n=1 Tax=Eimeria mitis TaxID=44415 RepID=U6K9U8_9EIME|nr:uncharacterized protein EMH_0022290 [Eimeria mitis]CDJ34805.1 hypothetical protein EMH_0022290 [Eimeria mitis]
MESRGEEEDVRRVREGQVGAAVHRSPASAGDTSWAKGGSSRPGELKTQQTECGAREYGPEGSRDAANPPRQAASEAEAPQEWRGDSARVLHSCSPR